MLDMSVAVPRRQGKLCASVCSAEEIKTCPPPRSPPPCFSPGQLEPLLYTTSLSAVDIGNEQLRDCNPPPLKQVRGRPKGSRNTSAVEREDLLQRVTHCGACGQIGHNCKRTACPGQQPRIVDDRTDIFLEI